MELYLPGDELQARLKEEEEKRFSLAGIKFGLGRLFWLN